MMIRFWPVLIILGALAVIAIDARTQINVIAECKNQRIRPFTEKFFTFSGIYELVSKGEYQPKCL